MAIGSAVETNGQVTVYDEKGNYLFIKNGQRQWLHERNACDSVECLLAIYNRRRTDANRAVNAGRQRAVLFAVAAKRFDFVGGA